jgi:Protein of unknown function (DUF1761)
MQTKINYLAVIACALINMLLGMTWYGIFAEPWMAGNGLTRERVESMPSGATPYIISVLGALISGYVLSLIFRRLGVTGWLDGAKSGAAIGLFGMICQFMNNAFSLRSMDLAWVDGGYILILFTLYGALLGGWRSKG